MKKFLRILHRSCSYLIIFLVVGTVGIGGCATPIQNVQSENVDQIRMQEGRYTVYYRADKMSERKQSTLQRLASSGRNTAVSVRKQEENGDILVNKETTNEGNEKSSPDFDSFQEQYGEKESGKKNVYDPLEGYNRFMFQFNDDMYRYVFKPVANGWTSVMPKPGRLAIDRFFTNLLFPVRFVNSLLQIKMEGAGRELGRFVMNTTVGGLGFFDPAKHWMSWSPSEEDFGQTLGAYGVGGGPPLVLPIFGHKNLRDAIGMIPDWYLDPVTYLEDDLVRWSVRTVDRINFVSVYVVGVYDNQRDEAIDPYTFFRNMYSQNRKDKVQE